MSQKERIQFALAILVIELSRIPFLFFGYGSEEDAWALPLVTERIAATGQYEVSRLPGHPFQELFYTLMWNSGPFGYNLITLFISTAGITCFMFALRKLQFKNWIAAGFALALTPVVYINCTNDMDYTWAMGFTLVAFSLIIERKIIAAGLFLAMATGCRITSAAMLLPFAVFIYSICESKEKNMAVIKFISSTILFTLLIFIPVFKNYGLSFFTYYEHFPLPGFAKNFYKGTIAVWGSVGIAALLLCGLYILLKRKIVQQAFIDGKNISKPILFISALIIVLYTISFLQVPLKAAFIIPLIPFVWIILLMLLPERFFRLTVMAMLISVFSFGVNLSDPLRGSTESVLSKQFILSGQKIVIDVLNGPLIADISKRQQRTAYAESVLAVTSKIQEPTVIIAGWWLADLLVLQRGKENKNVDFRYYTDEPDLNLFKEKNYRIFFLPEQDQYNDLRYRKIFTQRFAEPLPVQ